MRININEAGCVGCRICMLVCANRHGGEMRSSRIRIKDRDSLIGHNVEVCRQCDDRPCIDACPSDAISVDEKTGALKIDADECAGCGDCVEACPHDGITIVAEIAQVCDLCGGDPGCITACPVEALILEDD